MLFNSTKSQPQNQPRILTARAHGKLIKTKPQSTKIVLK